MLSWLFDRKCGTICDILADISWNRQRASRDKCRRFYCEPLENRQMLTAGLLLQTGDFVAEIQQLKESALARDSHAYIAPTAAELADFSTVASTLLSGDVATAASQAEALDYELVQFEDTVSGLTFYELREQLVDDTPTRGWGTYVLNLGFHSDQLVEVPHPLSDLYSWDVGADVYRQSGARGFLMAGAHRHANGPGTADVAHLDQSIFQAVHEVWNGAEGETTVWQVHGFNLENHNGDPGEDQFPAGTDLVLSNGDGGISAEIVDLDERLTQQGFLAYSYNTLNELDPLNQQVNDGIDGTTFSSLAATTNVQGIYSRANGGTFLHAELEQSIRFDAENRHLAATLFSQSMSLDPTFFVSSADVTGASLNSLQLTVDFNRPLDAGTLQADDLLFGDTAAVAVTQPDGDTAVFQLPSLSPGSYRATILSDTVAAEGQLGINEFHFSFDVAAAGSKFFVVDTSDDDTFEYDAAGELVESYDLASGNNAPRGAAADPTGQTLWVIDNDDFVYVYDDAGNPQGKWKAAGLSRPEGIATDGQDIWIVDRGTDRVYFYDSAAGHTSGRRGATASFALSDGNHNPRGITTDGVHLWVVNAASGQDQVFKYTTSGSLLGQWVIDSQNSNPRGITIDPARPENLWIVDNGTDAIYQYRYGGNRTSGMQTADAVFVLSAGDSNPQGIADPPLSEPMPVGQLITPIGFARLATGGVSAIERGAGGHARTSEVTSRPRADSDPVDDDRQMSAPAATLISLDSASFLGAADTERPETPFDESWLELLGDDSLSGEIRGDLATALAEARNNRTSGRR